MIGATDAEGGDGNDARTEFEVATSTFPFAL